MSQSKYAQAAQRSAHSLGSIAIQAVEKLSNDGSMRLNATDLASMISNENYGTSEQQNAAGRVATLRTNVETFLRTAEAESGKPGLIDFKTHKGQNQLNALTAAAVAMQNPREALLRTGDRAKFVGGPNSMFSADPNSIDPRSLGQATVEAYDTKPNEQMMRVTAAYALNTATQNPLGELFYPTVNLSPDEYAVELEVPLLSLHGEVEYDYDKQLTDFRLVNVVNAEADHTILKNDLLKIVPVYRQESASSFVSPSLIAPTEVITERGPITTAPLKINTRASLLRVAQTDAELAKNPLDQTDALDPNAKIDAIYLRFYNADNSVSEVVRFDTSAAPNNNFTLIRNGQTRSMTVEMLLDYVTIGKNTKLHNGSPSTLLAAFQGENAHTAWLNLSVRGDINLRDSSYEILGGKPVAGTIKNAAGQTLDLEGAANAAIVATINRVEIIAFDLDASFVNSNLRNLGQLVDFNTYRMTYGVGLGSPLTVQRPITNGDSQDALHAAALSYLTKVRQSNRAVTQLLSQLEPLRQYQHRDNVLGRSPAMLGISSWLVEPTLVEQPLDLNAQTLSNTQQGRIADIRALSCDTIRLVAYRMWQKSNWQLAANLLEGTEAELPEVAIGCDQVYAQYIHVEGDTRTVGPDFSFRKAMTPDRRMLNKIFLAFNYKGAQPGMPHVLNHGMMLNKAETVAALNLSRSTHSRELIVHPSFRHIWLTPVMGYIEISGLDEALTVKSTFKIEGKLETTVAAGSPGSTEDNPVFTKDAA